MPRLLSYAVVILLIMYPVIVYYGLSRWGVAVLAPVLVVVFALRMVVVKPARGESMLSLGVWMSGLGLVLAALSWIFNTNDWMLYYPVAVSLCLLAIFAGSLLSPPSVVERIALAAEGELDEQGVRYARRVTKVWCGFFVFNGSVALYTCVAGNLWLWALYNGAISYMLMGLLVCVEWLVRKKVRYAT